MYIYNVTLYINKHKFGVSTKFDITYLFANSIKKNRCVKNNIQDLNLCFYQVLEFYYFLYNNNGNNYTFL